MKTFSTNSWKMSNTKKKIYIKRRKKFPRNFLYGGCLLIIAVFVIGGKNLHKFLALSKPIKTDVIIIEGWLFDYMLDSAAIEIKRGDYQYIIVTGEKRILKNKNPNTKITNTAEHCKMRLIKRGIPPEKIYAIDSKSVGIHHTYAMASAIKGWLIENNIAAVNVFTSAPHARKTYHIFRRALGGNIKVGVIPCEIKHYDPEKWWASKKGFSVTMRYFIGYIYSLIWPFELFSAA